MALRHHEKPNLLAQKPEGHRFHFRLRNTWVEVHWTGAATAIPEFHTIEGPAASRIFLCHSVRHHIVPWEQLLCSCCAVAGRDEDTLQLPKASTELLEPQRGQSTKQKSVSYGRTQEL